MSTVGRVEAWTGSSTLSREEYAAYFWANCENPTASREVFQEQIEVRRQVAVEEYRRNPRWHLEIVRAHLHGRHDLPGLHGEPDTVCSCTDCWWDRSGHWAVIHTATGALEVFGDVPRDTSMGQVGRELEARDWEIVGQDASGYLIGPTMTNDQVLDQTSDWWL